MTQHLTVWVCVACSEREVWKDAEAKAERAEAEMRSVEQIADARTFELAVGRRQKEEVLKRAQMLQRKLEEAWRERQAIGQHQVRG